MSSDAQGIVERYWPYDGPHDDETVTSAAEAAAEMTRYLANATRNPATLPYLSTVGDVLDGLGLAVSRLDQIGRQLAHVVERHADSGELYDDRADRLGNQTANELAAELAAVRAAATQLADRVAAAAQSANHLGHVEGSEQ